MSRRDQVLVVDDEVRNRELIHDILSPLGYSVSQAADGEEALEVLTRNHPDLILLDIRMPRRDGFSVLRELKKNPLTRLIPVVILTSLSQLSDKLQAVEIGADDFLSKPFDVNELTTRVRSLLSLKHFTDELEHASQVLGGIAQIVEERDEYTGDHCKRLGEYSVRIARAMGLDEEAEKLLRLGGIFHDLGKIAVPDSVLNKPSSLTPEERKIINTHPAVGAELLDKMRTMENVLPLVRHHHERLDGSGYPDGLKGDEISILVRITSVVDVYDAIHTKRPYKPAFPHEKCMKILRNEVEKGWWDQEVVETLARVLAPEHDPARKP